MDLNSNNSSSAVTKIIGGIVAISVCCACVVIVAAGALWYWGRPPAQVDSPISESATAHVETPIPVVPTLDRTPVDQIPSETVDVLKSATVPESNSYELSCRLERLCNIAETVQGKPYKVGDREKFWVINADTVEHTQIDATLLYITPHSYFWAQDGTEVNQGDVQALMDTFEAEIYPTNREFFGSEWTPGVDGDPRIYVIYSGGLGQGVGGYFNSTDSYNSLIKEHSNMHETFFLNTNQDLANEFTYGILAHEFVHMIQFPADHNESTWMIEGFADVGMFLNGYSIGGWDWAYVGDPDLQLTDWSGDTGIDAPHYGQSFLYLAYFLDRFGEEATKAVTGNPVDDLKSIDNTLEQLNITDPQTGQLVTADDVFMDWAAALYLKDGNVGDGRYTYHNYPDAPQPSATDVISDCPQSALDRSVNQYGIDYIKVDCAGDFKLHFSGSTVAGLLPVAVYSGRYAFWSNKGNASDMTLTHEFDFTNVSNPITLSYQTWFDVEQDWDYLYLEASTDGKTWEILTTPSGTDDNPSGASYGWAYTGSSGDWKQEQVDLSQFAGQKVQLRFEYITDLGVNGEGLLLDDVRVDAINYQSDFEADDGGWVANGFVRVENVLPQTYRLSLIIKGDTTTVTPIELNSDNTADIPLSLKRGDEVILIVTGMTRFTTIPAAYQIEVK
jgi:immune inhibitor A